MNYHTAFITLLGAAGVALDELDRIQVLNTTPEVMRAVEVLQDAIERTETEAGIKLVVMQISVPKRLHLRSAVGSWRGRLHKRRLKGLFL